MLFNCFSHIISPAASPCFSVGEVVQSTETQKMTQKAKNDKNTGSRHQCLSRLTPRFNSQTDCSRNPKVHRMKLDQKDGQYRF